jgi:hypothetical protein
MSIEVSSLIITVSLAFIGYFVTYVNNIRLSQRKERLERVNRQLGELYGPLFALTQASDRAWRAFRNKYRPSGAFFNEVSPPTDEELKIWRLWMSTVFMPNNLQMYQLILSKSDLLIEPEMPDCLLDLCAHVTAYQTVLEKWKNNDFSEHISLIGYPYPDLNQYARKSFEILNLEQAKLIGKH